MMNRACLLILGTLLMPSAVWGLSAQEIADQASAAAFYAGKDGRADVAMVIRNSRGRERTRDMAILRQNVGPQNGDQNVFVYFNRPADVNRTAFLVWKHSGSEDDRWLYLPALDVVRRIAATDERTSFVGSHFFYEDVSGRSPLEDTHTLLRTTDNYYVLESRPKNSDAVEYTYYHAYIHRNTFLPTRMEYYKADDRLYRVYEAQEVQTISGIPTVTRARMEDMDLGGETQVTYRNVRYSVGLPEDVFTERSLRNAPRQYLR